MYVSPKQNRVTLDSGVKLKAIKSETLSCKGCYFLVKNPPFTFNKCTNPITDKLGCTHISREDNRMVIFKEFQ